MLRLLVKFPEIDNVGMVIHLLESDSFLLVYFQALQHQVFEFVAKVRQHSIFRQRDFEIGVQLGLRLAKS